MSPSSEAHGLGPHVVGQRVVVRRLLRGETGPSGGPAMTDLLGVCTAWGDGACVVEPESGAPVRIAWADIVSGKPVPPRPSVRQRVSARDAELHTHALWPRVRTEALGDWLLRTDPAPPGRLLKRANSCLAMGDPGVDLDAATRAVREFYAARGRPAIVQVERGSSVDAALVGRRLVARAGRRRALPRRLARPGAARRAGGRCRRRGGGRGRRRPAGRAHARVR